MEEDIPKSKRLYYALSIRPKTKIRIDTIYFKLKMKNGYKSRDEFLSEALDAFEKSNGL